MGSTCEHPKEELQKPGRSISFFSSHEFMTHLVHKEQSPVHVEKPKGLRKPVHSIFLSPSQEFVTYLIHKEHSWVHIEKPEVELHKTCSIRFWAKGIEC